jgi:hypothetical protein
MPHTVPRENRNQETSLCSSLLQEVHIQPCLSHSLLAGPRTKSRTQGRLGAERGENSSEKRERKQGEASEVSWDLVTFVKHNV